MDDILLNAIQFVHLPIYYRLAFVSRAARNCALSLQARESQECNHLWVLIGKLPDKDWDWDIVCNHSATTWERICGNFDMIKSRINIYKLDIGRNLNMNIDGLISNSYIFPDGLPAYFTMRSLASRSDFTIKYIEKYGTSSLHSYLSWNPNITVNYILLNRSSYWSWADLSANSGIPIEDILMTDYLPWRWQIVGLRQDLISVLAGTNVLLCTSASHLLAYIITNSYLTHEVATKFGIETQYLFNHIPIEVLKAEGLYCPGKTARDYSQICKVALSAKYLAVTPDLHCTCRDCLPGLRKRETYPALRSYISKRIQSYRDVIDDPNFDWNFRAISAAKFANSY